jgi:hypothetical protein
MLRRMVIRTCLNFDRSIGTSASTFPGEIQVYNLLKCVTTLDCVSVSGDWAALVSASEMTAAPLSFR